MNATQEMWLVIANGQKVMGREMLTLAQQGRSADDVAECVKLANFCAYIETVARRKAFQGDCDNASGGYTFECLCEVCGKQFKLPHRDATRRCGCDLRGR